LGARTRTSSGPGHIIITHIQIIWTSGIDCAGCVPEVFYCKDPVSWSTDKFILDKRIIPLRDRSSVSLSPQVFRQMLRLSKPTLIFKGEDSKQLLAKNNNELDLFPHLLENPLLVPEDITSLQVSSFRNPFREIA
jgi:hypothetical protein